MAAKGVTYMPVYQKMYFTLFNCLTDVAEELKKQNYGKACDIIQSAQLQAEELYIGAGEEPDTERD